MAAEVSAPASRAFNAALSFLFRFELAINQTYKYKEFRLGYMRSPRHLMYAYHHYTLFRIKTKKDLIRS